MSAPLTSHSPEALEHLAHRRARAKLGWWIHACVYLIVNLGLMALSWHQGRHWAVFPALGWGLGLVVHGLAVFGMQSGSPVMERLVARERAQLQAQAQHRP
ncbi:MAG: 2TM domain-containing protein [Comamonas sp.]